MTCLDTCLLVQEALKVTCSAKRSGLSDRSFYEPCNLCSWWESGYERKKQYFLFVLPFFEAATDVIKMKVSQEDLENTALSMEQKGIPIFFFIVPFLFIKRQQCGWHSEVILLFHISIHESNLHVRPSLVSDHLPYATTR